MPFKRRGSLLHLHQRNHAFLHSGSSGTAKQDDRELLFCGPLHRTGDLFTHHIAHTSHQETGVDDANGNSLAFYGRFAGHDSLIQSGLFAAGFQLLFISRKLQRIRSLNILVPGSETSPVHDHSHPALRVQTKIGAALGTGIIVGLHIVPVNQFLAFPAFGPEGFQNIRFLPSSLFHIHIGWSSSQ